MGTEELSPQCPLVQRRNKSKTLYNSVKMKAQHTQIMNVVIMGNPMTLCGFIKKYLGSHTGNLTTHLKVPIQRSKHTQDGRKYSNLELKSIN